MNQFKARSLSSRDFPPNRHMTILLSPQAKLVTNLSPKLFIFELFSRPLDNRKQFLRFLAELVTIRHQSRKIFHRLPQVRRNGYRVDL